MKSILLVALGFLALGVGAVGIVIPILPTTPFVLVSAACFGSSSPWLYNKLLHTRYFGEFVDNYRNKTGVAASVKTRSILFLWVTLTISGLVFPQTLTRVILLLVGIGVTLHIVTMRTRKADL